jgi:predicted dehydrogenase
VLQPQQIRCAIIGLTPIASAPAVPSLNGGRGILPYSHASALARIPNATVVAICDIVPAMTEKFAAQWGETWPEMTIYHDAAAMMAEQQIDVLSVVTPDNRHADIVVSAAAAGIPAIMCEKPLATTLEDADRMIAAVEAHDTKISVEHTRRWDPYWHQIKRMIESGAIGDVISIVGTLHGERAMLYRNGTHLIDLINYYAGSAPERVFARLEPGFDDFLAYRGDGGHDPASEPGGTAYIEYANGIRGVYNGVKGKINLFEIDVLGTAGRFRMNSDHAEYWSRDAENGQLVLRPFPANLFMIGGIQGAYEELFAAMQGHATIRSTPRDARQAISVIDAILRSNHAGGTMVETR